MLLPQRESTRRSCELNVLTGLNAIEALGPISFCFMTLICQTLSPFSVALCIAAAKRVSGATILSCLN